MIPVHIALWLALLLDAGSEPATPDTLRCRLAGHVFIVARDTVPARFADLIVLGTHMGAMTDETGAYVVNGLPPGTYQVKVLAIGRDPQVESVMLVAGQTTRRNYWIGPMRYDVVRDSLAALGQWPPSLDPGVLEHMRGSHDVRVFRLDPDRPAFGAAHDPEHRIGPWPIVSEAPRPGRHQVEHLIDAMRATAYHLRPRLRGEPQKLCGGFSPGIDVRFTRDGAPVDVLLCYRCYELSILRSGQGVQSADFSDAHFVEFAKHAFPHDPVLSRLRVGPNQHHH
jgi:hypothetical protein